MRSGGSESGCGTRGNNVLGGRQAPNSHLGIPEGHLPGTGQMAPRNGVGESGEQGRGTPCLDRERSGDPECADSAWMRVTRGRRARIQGTKPKIDRMAALRGEAMEVAGAGRPMRRQSIGRGAQGTGEAGDDEAGRRRAECGS